MAGSVVESQEKDGEYLVQSKSKTQRFEPCAMGCISKQSLYGEQRTIGVKQVDP